MSVLDSARETLARITAYDAVQPQAWICRFPDEEILRAAVHVDSRLAAGEDLPLAGMAFAIKDNIDVEGLPTTAACPAFSYMPQRSAAVVERLLVAGAIAVGKTNLDQFATGLVGTRSPYGAPTCVYNHDYISGGSSSGSAVVVAAGLVPFALGSDTAGSGRVPAAFNGIVGLKPTKGRWSTRGLVPACRSLDCVSVFTRDVSLASSIDDVLASFDPDDVYSRRVASHHLPARPRYGVPKTEQLDFFGDPQAEALYAAALRRLEGEVVEVDIEPLLAAARLLYAGPWVAERTAAVKDLLTRQPEAIHPVVRAIVQPGAEISAVAAFEGQHMLAGYARAADGVWSEADVLVLPTTGAIYRLSEVLAEPFDLNVNLGLYTNFVNLLDFSAIALPAGFRDNGTGFGISLIAPAWADRGLIDLASRYVAASPMPQAPPLDLALPRMP